MSPHSRFKHLERSRSPEEKEPPQEEPRRGRFERMEGDVGVGAGYQPPPAPARRFERWEDREEREAHEAQEDLETQRKLKEPKLGDPKLGDPGAPKDREAQEPLSSTFQDRRPDTAPRATSRNSKAIADPHTQSQSEHNRVLGEFLAHQVANEPRHRRLRRGASLLQVLIWFGLVIWELKSPWKKVLALGTYLAALAFALYLAFTTHIGILIFVALMMREGFRLGILSWVRR